jgi:class 3 adenylate cyclase
MVGFTAISEQLGEEGTFALIQPIYELMACAVKEQGGSVKDFTGDGIMALFGAPEALEDAPLRACRAALLIHERLARISQTPMSIVGIASIITVHDCIDERVRCAFGAADFGLSRVSGGPGVGMPRLEGVAATRQTAAARVR